jgi:cytochrome c-type biogenesis protein CcmE
MAAWPLGRPPGTTVMVPGAASVDPPRRRDTWSRRFTIMASAAVVMSALGYLLYTTAAAEMEWYKHVDEVLARPAEWGTRKLQLHGRVSKGSLMRRAAGHGFEYRFRVEHNGQNMEARYTGIVPDTFKEDAEVVLKGRLVPAGYFQVAPNGVMAKCPSKYEAKKK